MLYYTFAEGSTRGIFSGRFVFKVHAEADGDADTLVGDIESSLVANYGRTLAHEKAHHEASSYSSLGSHLVGQRFLARLMFGFGKESFVEKYYQRRTLYFALTYCFHEKLVDRMIERSGSEVSLLHPTRRQTPLIQTILFKFAKRLAKLATVKTFLQRPIVHRQLNYIFHPAQANHITQILPKYFPALEPIKSEVLAIRCLDKRILALPSTVKFTRLPFFLHPFNLLGALASREFGVVLSVQEAANQTTIREATTRTGFGGIFNSAFTQSARDNFLVRAMKAIHRILNIEGLFRHFGRALDEEKHRRWILIKLQAEYDTICELYALAAGDNLNKKQRSFIQQALAKFSTPQAYFSSYLITIFSFNLKFNGISPIFILNDLDELKESILAALACRNFANLSPEQAKLLSSAGGLFFYHGN